jgi:hypothetical protein
MRTFRLIRDEDPTGISGTGEVAEGVEFYDGVVVMRWRGPIEHPWGTTEATTVVHPNIQNVEHLHGHNGQTHIEWEDQHERADS